MSINKFSISNSLNKDKIFLLNKNEIEKRLDPQFYKKEFKDNLAKIVKSPYKRLGDIVKFSNETWNQTKYFASTFPYIEISEIDTVSGEILNIHEVEKDKAPSRAKMIVRENDILISTTRPNRGAISLIKKENDFSIASNGFSVIREILDPKIHRGFLFSILRQQFLLMQFEQRSSGGNYPAITQEELSNTIIPIPNEKIQNKVTSIFENYLIRKKQNDTEAEKLLASIDDYLLHELGITLPPPPDNSLKKRLFFSTIKSISGVRFDPYFHQKYFEEVACSIRKAKFAVSSLKNQLSFIESGVRPQGGVSNYDEGILSFGGEHVNNFCEVEVKTPKYIPNEFHKIFSKTETKLNDILIVKDGATTGKVGIINKQEYIGHNINEHVFLLRPTNSVDAIYLVNYLNSSFFQTLLKKIITGATVTGITKNAVKAMPFIVPPRSKQIEIAEHITEIRKKAKKLKEKTKAEMEKAGKEIERILFS